MRKVCVCYMISKTEEIELPDEMVEAFINPLDDDPDFCLYNECRSRLKEDPDELLFVEDIETGRVLCEW